MYLLRSKSCPLKSRDPQTGEMKDIGPRAWVEFEALPADMSPEGDGEITVKVIECDEDMAAAMAENERMAIEDAATDEARVKLRQERAERQANDIAEKAAAVAKKHGPGWVPPDPDRDRLIAAGWTPPQEIAPAPEVNQDPPEDPRLLDAEGNALTLEDFVERHDAEMKKDEIVEWAEGLGVVAEGTKAEILGVIYASVPAG